MSNAGGNHYATQPCADTGDRERWKIVREHFKRVIVHISNICNILDMCTCVIHGMYSTTTTAVQTMQLIVMSGFVCALGQFDSL